MHSKLKLGLGDWPILVGCLSDGLLMLRDIMPEELRFPILLFFLLFNGQIFYCFLMDMSYDHRTGIALYGTVLTIAALTLVLVAVQELLKIY